LDIRNGLTQKLEDGTDINPKELRPKVKSKMTDTIL